jgi:hypothetical protein
MNQANGKKVHIRVYRKPVIRAQVIYKAVGYKMMSYYREKFVFPENGNYNYYNADY